MSDPTPREIERACLEALKRHWRKRTEPYPVELAGYSEADMLEDVRVVLDACRVASVAIVSSDRAPE